MRKNTLYTVNKGNKSAFTVDRIYHNIFDALTPGQSQQMERANHSFDLGHNSNTSSLKTNQFGTPIFDWSNSFQNKVGTSTSQMLVDSWRPKATEFANSLGKTPLFKGNSLLTTQNTDKFFNSGVGSIDSSAPQVAAGSPEGNESGVSSGSSTAGTIGAIAAAIPQTPIGKEGTYWYTRRGAWDLLDPGYNAGRTKYGHLSTGVGDALGDLGTAVTGATASTGYGALVGAAIKSIGNIINNGWGVAWNQQLINGVEENKERNNAAAKAISQAEDFDDLSEVSRMLGPTYNITADNVGAHGVFSGGKVRDKARELQRDQEESQSFALRGLENAVSNMRKNQINDFFANYAAYGGPLGYNPGALGLMQQNSYFDVINKRTDAIAEKNRSVQPIFTGAKTYADGGLKATFLDEFGKDPIAAAVRYNRGLEALAAQEEAKEIEAAREAEYLATQKRLADLETTQQGLQSLMAAQPAVPLLPEIPETSPSSFTPSPATSAKRNKNATWDYIEDQLKKSGKFNDIQIEGIKYNLQRESSINPDIVGDGGAAFGLAQWHGSRKPKDMSLEGQTKHLIETLSNYDGKEHWIGRSNYEGFLNAKTPEEAHYYITKGYERPAQRIVDKVKRDSDMSLKKLNAFGGELGTNGTDFTNGLLQINEGGSHSENPLEGVPLGVDAEGIPNLVEEGETVYNDYVFSDRMKVPGFMYKELGLGGVIKKKGKEMSFADASKKLAQESEQRPNDPISIAGLNASLSRLAEVQETERMRKQAEDYMGLEGYACGGKMKNKYLPGGPINPFKNAGFNIDYSKWNPQTSPTLLDFDAWMKINDIKNTGSMYSGEKPEEQPKYNGKDRSSNFDYGKAANNPTTWIFDPEAAAAAIPAKVTPETSGISEKEREAIAMDGYTPEYTSRDAAIVDGLTPEYIREGYNPYPTWMRYAPVAGAGIMSLTDMLGLTNKPDYTYADKLEAAANAAGYAPHIEAEPIGNYLRYNPMDIWYQQNALNAQARATDRGILNSGANQGSKMAGLLASGYNSQLASGNLYRQALEYNDAKRQAVEDFNRKTNMFNSQMGLEAAMANARYRQQAASLGLSGLAQAAALRDQIDARTGAAKAANLSNFFTSLGNIGKENFAINQINSDRSRQYGVYKNGVSEHKRSSKGKKNSRWT